METSEGGPAVLQTVSHRRPKGGRSVATIVWARLIAAEPRALSCRALDHEHRASVGHDSEPETGGRQESCFQLARANEL